MSKIQVGHLKTALNNLFKDLIDMRDVKKDESEKENHFYSRALAAYALHVEASITPDIAAKAIVDGHQDNGLDAIFYDHSDDRIYIVQSKMIASGNGEPESGDIHKFTQGIRDLINEKYNQFNSKVNTIKNTISAAFENSKIKLTVVLAYTGKGFSPANTKIIKDLLDELNESADWVNFEDFNLKLAHSSINTVIAGKPIESELSISNWGMIDDPYTAYYGQISAYDLAALWKDHRKKLFTQNIRNYIGLSDINETILSTVENNPESFIYLNNGVTIICDSVTPLPAKTVGKTTGLFSCKGLTIINGAQTVGSLGVSLDKFPEQLRKCKVIVRLIPLENAPENFGYDITVASNTQNKIEKRDFVALDPIQERIRIDFVLTDINYHYKRTDEVIPNDGRNCTLEESTIALACAQKSVAYSVTAKREIGRLWEDIKKPPYTDLFNDDLKSSNLWKLVQVYRFVASKLDACKKSASTPRVNSIYTYGNYFITSAVINKLPLNLINNPNESFDTSIKPILNKITNDAIEKTTTTAESLYPSALIHQLFRNYTKCKAMMDSINS